MPQIIEMPPCAKIGARCGVHSAGAPPFEDCGPNDPTPLPVAGVKNLKSKCFYITPDPHHPQRWTWGCEDCSSSDVATGSADLGDQLAHHVETCR